MQQTAALPGGGSVTIDFNSSFDIGSFFGRVPQTPDQRETNARRDEDLTRRPANVPSEGDRSNSVPSELEPGLNNLINMLQQTNQMAGNIQNQFGQGNSTTSAFPNVAGQSIPDDGMLNVIQGIVGQVMGAMGVPSASGVVHDNQSPTISQNFKNLERKTNPPKTVSKKITKNPNDLPGKKDANPVQSIQNKVYKNMVQEIYSKRPSLQVNLFQKHLFLHQLTHNLTKDCFTKVH